METITESQRWDAGGYARHARFVSDLGAPVLALLAPQPGERILDLGCGDGALTRRLAEAGTTVVGIDSSAELIAAASALGIDARRADAQRLAFAAEFDAVFSNAALHWMREADAVIDGVRRALRPGGRFVGEFGGHGNVAAIVVAIHAVLARRGIDAGPLNPWYFPTPAAYSAKLEQAGFEVTEIALHPRPTPLPTDMAGWLATFANPLLGALSADDRAAATAEAVALLRPALADEAGRWTADYVRLRFAARLPS